MKTAKKTARFYTESGMYNGWNYLENNSFLELRSWVKSGNHFFVGEKKYTNDNLKELFGFK